MTMDTLSGRIRGRWLATALLAVGLALATAPIGAAPIGDEGPAHGSEADDACLDALFPVVSMGSAICEERPPAPPATVPEIEGLADRPTSGHGSGLGPGCAVPTLDDRCEAWRKDGYSTAEGGPRGDTVYTTGYPPATLNAVDARTGEANWTTSEGLSEVLDLADISVSPDASTVYLTDLQDEMDGFANALAYDADTGELLWETGPFEVMADISANPEVTVAPDGGTVFVTSTSPHHPTTAWNMQVHAFDADTGDELWRGIYNHPADRGDFVEGIDVNPDGSQVFVSATSVTGDYTVFEYPREISVVSFDAATGDIAWSSTYSQPEGETPVRDDPIVSSDGERVYVAGTQWTDYPHNRYPAQDYVTIAYDTTTGDELWDARYDGPPVGVYNSIDRVRAMTVDPGEDERVYVTGMSGGYGRYAMRTVAYDGATGELQWLAEFDMPGHRFDVPYHFEAGPDGEHVYVFGESVIQPFAPGSLVTLSYDTATGDQEWVGRMGDNPTDDIATVETRSVYPNSLAVTGSGDHVVSSGLTLRQAPLTWHYTSFAYETGGPDLLPGGVGTSSPTGTGTPAVIEG